MISNQQRLPALALTYANLQHSLRWLDELIRNLTKVKYPILSKQLFRPTLSRELTKLYSINIEISKKRYEVALH